MSFHPALVECSFIDVYKRQALLGKPLPNPALIDEEVVIIADDLTPSDTAQLNKNLVRGFATNIGGRTSHSAITVSYTHLIIIWFIRFIRFRLLNRFFYSN